MRLKPVATELTANFWAALVDLATQVSLDVAVLAPLPDALDAGDITCPTADLAVTA